MGSNPTAQVSTFPAAQLRLSDFGFHTSAESDSSEYRKGDDASRFGKRVQRESTRIRSKAKSSVGGGYCGTAEQGRGFPLPGDTDNPLVARGPNASKPRGAYGVLVDAVIAGRVSLDDLPSNQRRSVKRTIANLSK